MDGMSQKLEQVQADVNKVIKGKDDACNNLCKEYVNAL